MYRALYQAYRPQSFSDVCGQPHVVQTLRRQVAQGQISHAYLFTGSRGTGKTTCARILAKAVNCLHPVDGDPCNECEICRGIDDESILDVVEMDAASNNGVNEIRDLRDNTAFSPAVGKYRVYIIDEVHMLSGAAFNALLKTLEEPPEHVVFILATTEVHKLPATVLSRCQRFDFRRISPDDIADRLIYVAGQEGFTLTREAALLIARLSDGAMRDALSLLDVCRTGVDKVDEETVVACAGLSGRAYLSELLRACFAGDAAAALTQLAELYDRSKDLGRLCAELVAYLRDLMLIKTLRSPERLLVGSAAEIAEQEELAGRTTLEAVLHAMDLFETAAERMRAGADRRVEAETAVVKLCRPALDASPEAILRRLERLEAGAPLSAPAPSPAAEREVPAAPAASPAAPAAEEEASAPAAPVSGPEEPAPAEQAPPEEEAPPAPAPAPAGQTGVSADAVPFARWHEVVAALTRTDPLLKAVLGGSTAYESGDYMLLQIANESFRDMVNNDPRHRNNLKQAIASVTGRSYKIGPYAAERPRPVEKDPLDRLADALRNSGAQD